MIANTLKRCLDEAGVEYEVTQHEQAFTAAEVAHAEELDEWSVAKSVILLTDDGLAMVVLPAALKVDLQKAGDALGTGVLRLADEREFLGTFPDCEPGAEPPFGSLYGVPTFIDGELRAERITFNAGSHQTTVTMALSDYLHLAGPVVVDLTKAG